MKISLIFAFTFLVISSCQVTSSLSVPDREIQLESITVEENASEEITYIEPIPENVWEYMITKSSLNENVIINEQTLIFMNNHIKDLDKFNSYLNKSYYFIYYVIQELEAADLPVELALIPFIESNYDPFSISPSGAVGLWQFMPRTGRLFDLEKGS